MIKKEMFIKILEQIHNDARYADILNLNFKAMKNDFIDGAAFMNTQLASLCIELLDSCFGEDCTWVAYWVYELNYGEKSKYMRIEKDGCAIMLRTPEDLWNFLIDVYGE